MESQLSTDHEPSPPPLNSQLSSDMTTTNLIIVFFIIFTLIVLAKTQDHKAQQIDETQQTAQGEG